MYILILSSAEFAVQQWVTASRGKWSNCGKWAGTDLSAGWLTPSQKSGKQCLYFPCTVLPILTKDLVLWVFLSCSAFYFFLFRQLGISKIQLQKSVDNVGGFVFTEEIKIILFWSKIRIYLNKCNPTFAKMWKLKKKPKQPDLSVHYVHKVFIKVKIFKTIHDFRTWIGNFAHNSGRVYPNVVLHSDNSFQL